MRVAICGSGSDENRESPFPLPPSQWAFPCSGKGAVGQHGRISDDTSNSNNWSYRIAGGCAGFSFAWTHPFDQRFKSNTFFHCSVHFQADCLGSSNKKSFFRWKTTRREPPRLPPFSMDRIHGRSKTPSIRRLDSSLSPTVWNQQWPFFLQPDYTVAFPAGHLLMKWRAN